MTTAEQYASFFDEHSLHKSNTFYPYATWPSQKAVVWLYMHQVSLHTPLFAEFIDLLITHTPEIQGAMRVRQHQQQGLLIALLPCSPAFAQALHLLLVDKDWGFIENIPDFTQKGLLIMDMDSTAIAMECIDEVAQAYGCGAQVQAITEQAMQGYLGFEESLKQRLQCLTRYALCDTRSYGSKSYPYAEGCQNLYSLCSKKAGLLWLFQVVLRRLQPSLKNN